MLPLPSPLTGFDVVFVFGTRHVLEDGSALGDIRHAYPDALLIGCSTAGEIHGTHLLDNSLTATAVRFASTRVAAAAVPCPAGHSAVEAGRALGQAIDPEGLVHLLVFAGGEGLNGSDLVQGVSSAIPHSARITGGLAGDGEAFERTLVLHQLDVKTDSAVALGFYGDRLRVGYSSRGGWDQFGPERLITRSTSNVLYELDGQSALELYRTYLGEHARGLPATGLFFPLEVRPKNSEAAVVRTLLAVDDANHSVTFAGNVPEGSYARLMKANFNRLVDGAGAAAAECHGLLRGAHAELAICVSCVGRRMVLRQRVEEELEAVSEAFGEKTALTGFYSYGEICPSADGNRPELHNESMTVTALTEV